MDDGERSLPGTTASKWMRRPTERFGYEDICASPPINPDGFFHMRKFRQEMRPSAEQSACSEPGDCFNKHKEAAGSLVQVEQQQQQFAANSGNQISKAIGDMEKGNWMKGSQILGGFQLHRYVSDNDCSTTGQQPSPAMTPSLGLHKTASASALFFHSNNLAGSGGAGGDRESSLPPSPSLQQKAKVVRTATPAIARAGAEGQVASGAKIHPGTLAEATQEGQEIVPAAMNAPTVIITKPPEVAGQIDDKGAGLLSLIEKRLLRRQSKSTPCTPESTPTPSPVATPTSSPKMGRRSDNPFFTGSSNSSSGSGSWLFRPGQPEQSSGSDRGNLFYESKVEVQVNPATKTVNKNVRYVPRPSELRELNFWSPTSM